MNRLITGLVCSLLVGFAGMSAMGGIVYSNFGPGQSFDTNGSYDIPNVSGSSSQLLAFSFTPTANDHLASTPFDARDKMEDTNGQGSRPSLLPSNGVRPMATVASAPPEIEYPETDGEPMAETPIHRDVMLDQIVTLKAHFADEPNVYVSGNMMMYYVEGNADRCVSPDVFVTLGIPKRPERNVYKLWVEGKGPDAVIEVTSSSTARVDQRRKFDLYRDVLKVQEYFLFDPREKTLAGVSLCGYRLIDGEYELIPKTAGRLASEVLGLHLEAAGEQLRLYDPRRGVYLLTPEEIRETAVRETAAREVAEAQAAREAAAREAAEAEIQRLRLEIEALRRGAGPSNP